MSNSKSRIPPAYTYPVPPLSEIKTQTATEQLRDLPFYAAAGAVLYATPSDHLLFSLLCLVLAARAYPWHRGIYSAAPQHLTATLVLHGSWFFVQVAAVALVARHAF
jgi:hypothetical protein